jgi:hypothetical protein
MYRCIGLLVISLVLASGTTKATEPTETTNPASTEYCVCWTSIKVGPNVRKLCKKEPTATSRSACATVCNANNLFYSWGDEHAQAVVCGNGPI